MKEAIRVDLDGYYAEPLLIPDSQTGVTEIRDAFHTEEDEPTVSGYIVAEKVPEGLYRPRWDFTNSSWTEGWSQEQIDEARNAPTPLSPEQRIARLESESIEVMLGLAEIYETLLETNTDSTHRLQRLMSVFSIGKR